MAKYLLLVKVQPLEEGGYLAICPDIQGCHAEGETVAHEPGPSRDHTERMLARFEVNVEVEAEGQRNRLEKLVGYLNVGSPASKVEKIVTSWSEYTGKYGDFKIRY